MISLKPLTKTYPPKPKFAVCDIESRDWSNFVVIGYFDGETYEYFTTLQAFFEYIFTTTDNRAPSSIFAHFGGRFDFLFLLNEIFARGEYRLLSVIPRGSSILSFEVTDGERTFVFRDSGAFLPFSLRSITNDFNVATKKGEIDYEKITGPTPDVLAYLESDCRGLFECINLYFSSGLIEKAGPAYTTASQALRIFRTYLKEPLVNCPPDVEAFIRQGYFGGRTEIFKPLFEGPGEISCGDVNSLYPYVMSENEMPGRFSHESNECDLDSIGWIDCIVRVPSQYVPPLPVLQEGKLIFPVGRFRGVWSTAELKAAVQHHGARIEKTYSCYYFESAGYLFREFISDLYQVRKTSKKGSVEDITAKLAMNSLYGRFALNKIRENYELDNNQEGFSPVHSFRIGDREIRFGTKAVLLKTYSHVGIAAWTTSLSRVHMLALYRSHSDQLYYTDTDSVFTTKAFESSKELGGLKHEFSRKRACFLLPKTYVAESEDIRKIAMKGFSSRKIQHFSFNDFKQFLEGDMRKYSYLIQGMDDGLATFKTALRKGNILTKKGKMVKEIRSKYDKRIIVKTAAGGYDSRPIEINQ